MRLVLARFASSCQRARRWQRRCPPRWEAHAPPVGKANGGPDGWKSFPMATHPDGKRTWADGMSDGKCSCRWQDAKVPESAMIIMIVSATGTQPQAAVPVQLEVSTAGGGVRYYYY